MGPGFTWKAMVTHASQANKAEQTQCCMRNIKYKLQKVEHVASAGIGTC
jgi:hypothetical protein